MSGEDQERFEDYLELEHHIEELQAGRVAHPPAELTPSQASIYRMAALFRSSLPEANEPRPEFAAELLVRLEQELQQPSRANSAALQTPKQPAKRPGVSRRALLTGGAAIAASLIVGVGSGAAIEHAIKPTTGKVAPPTGTPNLAAWSPPLVPDNIPTQWHPVTTLDALGENAVPFSSGSVVGYIIRDDGDDGDPDKGQIIAMSAACTHMGCIVKWQDSDRKFHCPCHGGLFSEYGKVDTGAAPIRYLTPLPRLQTKVENGNVYVRVPASQT
ncbi:MAG: ubiquinol-cytochrome c reductase iron-sulfur subunit [Ktedonobacteraceae bacterium]